MKRNFMSILLALTLAVGSAAPAYAGEVFTFEAVPESGSKAEKQSAKNPMAMNGLPLNRSG